MVYIHLPENLTEEEQMLMAKYAKLKKKKKQVQALKSKPEPEKPLIPKRPKDARDAREVARKLIKSGAIVVSATSKSKADAVQLFKRPKGQERKKTLPEPSYHPFAAAATDEESSSPVSKSPLPVEKPESSRILNLYQKFENEKDSDKKSNQAPSNREKPRSGYTIYVSGKTITEEFLKKNFSEYGTIVNVSMEIEKGRGFITFSKMDSSDKAIAEMHGKSISGIQLSVSLARKQPSIEPINDASSSAVWSTLATSQSQKGNHKDKRELVVYDNVFD